MTAVTAFYQGAFYALGFQMDPSGGQRLRGGGAKTRRRREQELWLQRQREIDEQRRLERERQLQEDEEAARVREVLAEAARLAEVLGERVEPLPENAQRLLGLLTEKRAEIVAPPVERIERPKPRRRVDNVIAMSDRATLDGALGYVPTVQPRPTRTALAQMIAALEALIETEEKQ